MFSASVPFIFLFVQQLEEPAFTLDMLQSQYLASSDRYILLLLWTCYNPSIIFKSIELVFLKHRSIDM